MFKKDVFFSDFLDFIQTESMAELWDTYPDAMLNCRKLYSLIATDRAILTLFCVV